MTLQPDDLLLIQRNQDLFKLSYSELLEQLKEDIVTTTITTNKMDNNNKVTINSAEYDVRDLSAETLWTQYDPTLIKVRVLV